MKLISEVRLYIELIKSKNTYKLTRTKKKKLQERKRERESVENYKKYVEF